MRKKVNLILIALILTQVFFSVSGAYANGGDRSSRGRGGNNDGYPSSSYYKNYRYYPHGYYHNRKIYFSPKRSYYYYYDLLPNRIYYYPYEKTYITSNPSYLPITSIANMCSQGVPEEVIIEEIRRTGSTYKLTAESIAYLRQNGAGDRLINFMLGNKDSGY